MHAVAGNRTKCRIPYGVSRWAVLRTHREVTERSERMSRLGAAGFDLFGAGPAGELDEVLVELEPDAVVAVHAR